MASIIRAVVYYPFLQSSSFAYVLSSVFDVRETFRSMKWEYLEVQRPPFSTKDDSDVSSLDTALRVHRKWVMLVRLPNKVSDDDSLYSLIRPYP